MTANSSLLPSGWFWEGEIFRRTRCVRLWQPSAHDHCQQLMIYWSWKRPETSSLHWCPLFSEHQIPAGDELYMPELIASRTVANRCPKDDSECTLHLNCVLGCKKASVSMKGELLWLSCRIRDLDSCKWRRGKSLLVQEFRRFALHCRWAR